jgi:DNA-binding transcriptional ArsR family regulator
MAATADMLVTTLGETAHKALELLASSSTPMSGRMLAAALRVSPTTATAALRKLREAGFAASSREGRADRWRLNTDNIVVRSWLEEARSQPSNARAPTGMSPYATGGGGVTFERKVAVGYLAHLVLGDGAVELGDGRFVVSVAFQQAPEHSVDDLVVRAARVDELEPSLVLAVGVRRSPDLVQSDESTRKLIRAFVQEIIESSANGPEYRVALVVAGLQNHAEQLAWLAGLASKHMDAPSFFSLARATGKFPTALRERLAQIEALVRLALVDLGVADPSQQVVAQRTWELLSRLTVLMPRLETPDEADWAAVTNALIAVARGADLFGASQLRDRLVALADEYAPKAATVDLTLLRRDAHQVLEATMRRHRQGWAALAHLHERAIASVRNEIASSDRSRTIHLDRSDAAAELLLLCTGTKNRAVVAHGDSGTGKSSLVIGAVTGAANTNPDTAQAVCINLRHLPTTTLALESFLGTPLARLLAELSAPERRLVIDGADAISEGLVEPFRYLVDAGIQADVAVIAVAANDVKQLVRDTIAERSGEDVAEFLVPPLTDAQVDDVVATFPELSALATNPRSRELLRRPVVVDLLVRGGLAAAPLSDADAMRQVWGGLVRRREQSDRGTPAAREYAMLRLADLALRGGDPLDALGAIDPTALEGLRRDGLLRTPIDDPFSIAPEFTHDEVRRYAVARRFLADADPTAKLREAGVPRWALGAARLTCQAWLAAPDNALNPLRGRFGRLQAAFDALVMAGHGERWGDVPGEALLTLGDPDPVLRDAWPELRKDDGEGLERLGRLIDQRLRDPNGFVRITAVEPLIQLLLDDDTPWWSGEHVQDILREWLRAHVIASTPAGHPVRARLRQRLVSACVAADRRLKEERAAAATALAARSSEEIDEERKVIARSQVLLGEIGYPRSRQRPHHEVPREIRDEMVMELWALLGPDLGDDGESILRRVGQDAPSWLAPAVEGLLTGRALAGYRRGFLAELTEAYYIDVDEDGSGLHEDGIRSHRNRGFGVTPLAAWYRGPFMSLFQSDFRNGTRTLNRMLNHAALARARTLAGRHRGYGAQVEDTNLDPYRTELDISGARRVYVGDSHVWLWYRGTGVGPYPCMSALQALERVCDRLIEAGIPIANIVGMLLQGCENLAMVGLIVGLLVRHLEKADRLLDPFLAEPIIWSQEFGRLVNESSGLAANSDEIIRADRRKWSMREAATFLVVYADDARAAELRAIGDQLIANAYRLVAGGHAAAGTDDPAMDEQLAPIRAWASGLDRQTYQAQQTDAGLYIKSTPPDDVVRTLQRGNEDLHRAQEATRLMLRYTVRPNRRIVEDIPVDDLAADLALARDLLSNPPEMSAGDPWDTPTAVAASALSDHLLRGIALPDDLLRFAVDTVIRVGAGVPSRRKFEIEETYFEQAADRSAGRALPLLLLPSAAPLLAFVDSRHAATTYDPVVAACTNLAHAVANEVRLYLARGFDPVWQAPCTEREGCHHDIALHLVLESLRDSAFGEWDPEAGRRRTVILGDPIEDSLAGTPDARIHFSRLDAAIRALAPAAVARICISERAESVLEVALAAQRRSLLAHDRDLDDRGTHALVSARALLTMTADSDHTRILDHIDALADAPSHLGNFLRALASAAEEDAARAATARRIWPEVVTRVLDLNESGHAPFNDHYLGDLTLAALLPNVAGEVSYLYRELSTDPIVWWEPVEWREVVDRWLTVAAGKATCVDHLIGFLRPLPLTDQVRHGLPWLAPLVLANPDRVARGSFLLSTWLIESRSVATDAGLLLEWQRVVDALVVGGASRLAPYSE